MIPETYYAGPHRIQFDGSALAAENCTPTSGANGARAATGGRVDRSGGQIRELVARNEETNPATPGWSLDDLALAMRRLGVPFEIRTGLWSSIVTTHDTGLVVVLQGDSDQFPNGTCSGRFDGDHCVACHPGTYVGGDWPLADPICPTRRAEAPATLRAYATKFAAKVAGRPTSVIRYGVFPTPVPQEDDVKITAIKGEDWTPGPKTAPARRPVRSTPDRAAGVIVGHIEVGQIIRTIAEAETPDGNRWRQTKFGGQPGWILRSDFDPLVQGGDPSVAAELTAYIARRPAVDAQAVAEAEYARVKAGTTATATTKITFPPAP